jgi:hypothetical protein
MGPEGNVLIVIIDEKTEFKYDKRTYVWISIV